MYFLNRSKIQTFDDLRFYQVCQSPTMFYSCFEKNLFHPIKNIQMLTEVRATLIILIILALKNKILLEVESIIFIPMGADKINVARKQSTFVLFYMHEETNQKIQKRFF